MSELVFFYGTLMTPFHRVGRLRIDQHLMPVGRGSIAAALFDLGIYPAAVPASDGRVWGEVYEATQPFVVLQALDELEGYRPGEPEASLYTRVVTPVTLVDGRVVACLGVLLQRAPGPCRAHRIGRLPRTPESSLTYRSSGPCSNTSFQHLCASSLRLRR